MEVKLFSFRAIAVAIVFFISLNSCTKNFLSKEQDLIVSKSVSSSSIYLSDASTGFESLIAYKNSPHQLMVGYYRTWGDKVVNAANGSMYAVPDSVDIINVFPDYTPGGHPFWDTLRLSYIPYHHARGTKVVITTSFADFDWWKSITPGSGDNASSYAAYAQYKRNQNDSVGYDGLDIDVEVVPTGSTLTKYVGIMQALSVYFGPQSGTARLLILDTNKDGTSSFFRQVSGYISYLYQQAYWRTASSLTVTFNSYAPYISPAQFIVVDDFEDATGYSGNPPHIYSFANWQPTQGTKGGVGAYGIDVDWNNTNDGKPYYYTRKTIELLNPVSGGPQTGVVFYQNSNYGGTVTQSIQKGTYTLSQLQALGFVDNWASSVKIPTGWSVKMYKNNSFSGSNWTLTGNTADFGALSPSANDVVSSVIIQ